MPVTTCGRRARTSRRTPSGSRQIEERKQALSADDPELIELSAEAERIARGLVPKTVAQSELAAESVADGA